MIERPPGGTEEQFRLLMDCVTDHAIFLLDPEGRVSAWNGGAERLLGYSEAEVLGRLVSLFFTPEDIAAGEHEKELRVAADAGRSADDRWQVRKGGTRFWAGGVTTALREEAGSLRGFARVLKDRTEQRQLEEALLRNERHYRALVENAFDGITLIGHDGRILETAPSTFRVLGYSPEEYLGRNGFDLLHPDDAPAVRALLARVLAEPGGKVTTQYRLRHSDGTYRWVESVAANLLHDPAVAAVVVNHRDINERKEAERRKDEWLAMLAHELRGPLAPVRNAVQVLAMKATDDPDLRQACEVTARQTRHLARIVEDLLEVTRLIRGQIRLRRERLDLARLVRSVAEDYCPAASAAGLELVLMVPETPVWVNGDATRLGQVLGNLLDNALKFRDGGDRVEVTLRANHDNSQAILLVRDWGAGIEPELLAVLFDVFAQADRSLHRTKGGLGLGLALVKGLVGLHGGEVRAASAGPGRGSEFTVLLPREQEPPALAEVRAVPRPAVRRLRILVVEDSRDSADSLRLLLTLMGHEVRVAYTGPDGVRSAAEWLPEVILSDIGLPGLDGYGLAAEVRRRPETANVRLIAVTGYGSEEDRRRAIESGFDYHLTKPAEPAELQRLLAGSAEPNGNGFRSGRSPDPLP
jgi:PAS domain S-box-containing protein